MYYLITIKFMQIKYNKYRFLLALTFTIVLICCSSKKDTGIYENSFFTVSTKFGFKPNKRQYKTFQSGAWTRYRDHFFDDLKTNLLIQTILDTVSPSMLTVDTVFHWAYSKYDNVILDDTVNISGLHGFKCSNIMDLYDVATKSYIRFYETSWILQGKKKVFFIKFNSSYKERYEQSLMKAIKTVGTFREVEL